MNRPRIDEIFFRQCTEIKSVEWEKRDDIKDRHIKELVHFAKILEAELDACSSCRDSLKRDFYESQQIRNRIASYSGEVAAERDMLRKALEGLVGASEKSELEIMEIAMRALPAPTEDKAASLDAVHALLALSSTRNR